MRHQWVAYVIVALLSIGAGIAIAGLPNNVPVDATIVPPSTTVAPDPTVPTTTIPATTTTTTEPPVETTEPEPVETTVPETTVAEPAIDRNVALIAVNGADVAGTASRMAEQLRGFGWTNVAPRDGTEIRDVTWVYYGDGFEDAAGQIATELGLAADFVAPIAQAPEVIDLPEGINLMVYVGADRAN